ncbi:MAG: translation initiation factor IF-2 [Chlorobi bacterium]|nr:translation initiation factor IF-2 [Chlorobiota bacterium]
MPEPKKKKLRIYKFAAEYNLSTDALVEFLREKGHAVKSHMTILNDEMVADINVKFKKDIENAEKHYRRVTEFRRRHSDEPDVVEEETAPVEKTVPVEEESSSEETEKEELAEEQSEETETEEKVEAAEEGAVSDESAEETETPEHEIENKENVDAASEEKKEERVKVFKTEAEKEIEGKRTGLKVVGKMEIPDKKKPQKKGKPKKAGEETTDNKKAEDNAEITKKKKKRLKAKNKKKLQEGEIERVKRKRKAKKLEVDKKEVEAAIKRTLLSMEGGSTVEDRAQLRKKKRKEKHEIQEQIQQEIEEKEKSTLKVTEFIAVNELANLMNVPVSDVIAKCIGLGLMVSINQRLESEIITLVADEFGFDVEFMEEFTQDLLEDVEDAEETLVSRPPVVTIMGHVDHGKTSLLDYIRKANVVAGESGGITQHIGAYAVEVDNGKKITFLDTPGHEAFTAMRARGAKVTDIVILIVAADDAVMPQTIEAINHSLAASVPIIVAINKIDKPGANVEKIKQQLADRNILVEDWGGKYQTVELSAKTGQNVDLLLEKILLEAEMLELKANPNRMARGTVIESQLDKGRGITSTVLIQKGTLKVGDPFVAGIYQGKVRAMFNERKQKIDHVTPAEPALILGFEGVPQAGDIFAVVESDRKAREISNKRQQLKREQDYRQVRRITLDEIATQISQGGYRELPVVVKADVDGSVEALADSLLKLSTKEVAINIVHKGVGAISEGDVLLAAASQAIIVGFHVRPSAAAKKVAEKETVDIRLYSVIYDAINEIRSALEGLLSPVLSEEIVSTVEVRETFKVPKVGTVAGCYVLEGKITRSDKIRLIRDGVVIYSGELDSLKRFKDDVKEVDAGYECGLNIIGYNDIKVGDLVEAYKIIETKKKLDD